MVVLSLIIVLCGEIGCRKTMGDDIGYGWLVTRVAFVGEFILSLRVYLGLGRLFFGIYSFFYFFMCSF